MPPATCYLLFVFAGRLAALDFFTATGLRLTLSMALILSAGAGPFLGFGRDTSGAGSVTGAGRGPLRIRR